MARKHKTQPAKRFGIKLRILRKSHNLTLKELANALGYVAHGHISEIEAGKKMPTVAFVLAVADLFNVTTDELIRDDLDLQNAHTGEE